MNSLHSKRKEVEVPPEMSLWRLDRIMARLLPGWSRQDVGVLIALGGVFLNGKAIMKGTSRLGRERVLEVDTEKARVVEEKREKQRQILDFAYSGEPSAVVPEDIPIRVVYEDEGVVVVDKPAGMVVHPAYANTTGTLANAVCGYFMSKGIPVVKRMGLVSRLDKDVSGLVMIAKNDVALSCLSRQFSSEGMSHHRIDLSRKAWKYYRAIVEEAHTDALRNSSLELGKRVFIDGWMQRSPKDRKKFVFRHYCCGENPQSGEKYAASYVTLLSSRRNRHEIQVQIVTGRTHQIRVQLASIGLPVVNDSIYGTGGGYIKLRCEKVSCIPCWKHVIIRRGVLGVGEKQELDQRKVDRMTIEKRVNMWEGSDTWSFPPEKISKL